MKIIAIVWFLIAPLTVSAHAVGIEYELPLPVFWYIFSGTLALLVSFSVLGFSKPLPINSQPRLLANRTISLGNQRLLHKVLSATGLFFLFITIIAGLFGSPFAYNNPTPILFWVGLLIGFTYLTFLVDGLWPKLDPFKRIATLVTPKTSLFVFPRWLRYLPALGFFYLMVWIELLSPANFATNPSFIAIGLVGYLLVSIVGSYVFGVADWFWYGDFFTVFFGLTGLLAPIKLIDGKILIAWPGKRLLKERLDSYGLLLFILAMLAATAFDGFKETKTWLELFSSVSPHITIDTFSNLAWLLAPLLFFGLYALAIWLITVLVRTGESFDRLLLSFGYSLLPITLAYHIAHYFTLLFSEGARLLVIGSNFFGYPGEQFSAVSINPERVWLVQVSVIIIGHVGSLYLAHETARQLFNTRRAIIVSQLPMLVLMVCYTAFGLWILSQPFS